MAIDGLASLHMDDEPLLFPVVISRGQEVIAEACNKATATTLAAWEPLRDGDGPTSVAMGCKDGSVYIFRHNTTPSSPTDSVVVQESVISAKGQRPTSPRLPVTSISNMARLYGPPSPAASSSSSNYFKTAGVSKHASFQPSKSRVQAGISKEQVEAPKSYVNYEEEPAKLKSLLKTRDPKDRSLIDSLMPTLSIGQHQRTSSSDTHSQKLEHRSSYSQISTTQVSSTSTSPPASPAATTAVRFPHITNDAFSDGLKLWIHTFPPRFGQGRAVTALEYMEDGAILASLQECG